MFEVIKQYTFRQFLIPRNNQTGFNPNRKQHQINPKILNAIGDNSQPITPPAYIDAIVNFYKRYKFVVRPDNFFLLTWDALIILIVIFYTFQIGLLLCFQTQFWQFQLTSALWIHVVFILMLTLDIFISPFKAYYSDGLLVVDIQTIVKNYIGLELFIDISAVLTIAIPLMVGSLASNWIKIFWIIKLYTVSKINIQFQRITQLYISYSTIYLCIKLAIVLIIYAHYMGIGFYLVSLWVYDNNYYGPNTPNICWIYNSQAFYKMNILLSWQQIYIYIMYYSIGIVTTIAYGDIIPLNPIQCIYMIFTFIMFAIVFGYVFTEIIRLLVNVYSYNFQRRYNHFELIQQLKSQNVPLSTRTQVRAHTEEIDREEQYRNRQVQDKILNFLPADPLYGLLLVIYRDFLKRLEINFAQQHLFQKFKPIAQKSLFLQIFMKEIKQQRQYIGDIIYQAGQIQSEAQNGHCAYYYAKKQYKNAITLGVGQIPSLIFGKISYERANIGSFQLKKATKIYGQVQFLTGQERSHWAICQMNCVVFVASRNSLLNNYHLLTQQQKQIIFLKMERAKQIDCYICQREHFFLDCPYTFAKFDNLIQKDTKVRRNNKINRQFRTRLKTESSWTIYSKIRHQRLEITKQYKDKLLMDKINQQIFIQEKLEEDNTLNEQEEQMQLQEKIYEIEAIIQKVQDNEVEQFNAVVEQLQFDKAFNFKHYRVYNNIWQIETEMNHPSQRKANLEDMVQANLMRLFQS